MKTNKIFSSVASFLMLLLVLQSVVGLVISFAAPVSPVDSNFQLLPYTQNWSNIGLITADDDWSGIPGILGYRGDGLTTTAGIDPQTVLADGNTTPLDVIANQDNPALTTGGVAEFEITDPVIALQGSGTADAPFLLLSLNTSGYNSIQVSYKLRDIDGSSENAVQPVSLQYRLGGSGNFINVPAGFVDDATSGPNLATLVTHVNVTLPSDATTLPLLQLRIITTNAGGNDEWVGVDDLSVSGTIETDGAPVVVSTSPYNGYTNFPLSKSLVINFNEPINVTENWFNINCNTSGVHAATVSADSSSSSYTLSPTTPFVKEEDCTVTIYATQVTDRDLDDPPDQMKADYSFRFTTVPLINPESCMVHSPISSVQGSGESSFFNGTVLNVEGVVTGDFQGEDRLDGFFLQDGDGTRSPNSSEGIFVYAPGASDVQVGDLVWVRGLVVEYLGNTELWNIEDLRICDSGQVMAPVPLNSLPTVVGQSLERFENMLVTLPQTLTVTDNEFLGEYGEIVVSEFGRLYYPNNDQRPDWETNESRRLVVDDGSEMENLVIVPYLSPDAYHTLRLGDTVSNLTGVLTYAHDTFRLHPTILPTFVRSNPRPDTPMERFGSLRVASMNVGSYFNGDGQGGGFPTTSGADSFEEFQRQSWKIVSALVSLDVDVIGLEEMENDGIGPLSAIQDLIDGLTDYWKYPTYTFIHEPAPGSSDMKISLLYRPAVVTPIGAAQNFQTSTAAYALLFDHPPLAQLFQVNDSGQKLWVVINHFASRENCPATGPDADQGDGQGCWNARRVTQAAALLDFVASLKTVDPDVLVLGDLNAYGLEDPIYTLLEGGLIDQAAQYTPLEEFYSFVFGGQAGTLDHAFSTNNLDYQIMNVVIQHINADEPPVLDYNLEIARPPYLYNGDCFRSSDHDPVIVDLELNAKNKAYIPLIKRP